MKKTAFSMIAASLAVATSFTAPAQETGQAEQVEKRISLLAIGNPPEPRYVIREDRRHLLDTAAAESPPGEVMVREKSGEKESFKGVPLGLNSPTGYITYKGERKLVLFREANGGDRSEFASLTLPELKGDLAVFLIRNRKNKSWESEPEIHYFDNSLVAFPKDSVRVINLSTVIARAQINDGRVLQIDAGRSAVVRIPRKDQGVLTYRVAGVAGDKIHPLIDTANTTMPDTRLNIVVYNCDSADSRMVVDVATYFERPPVETPE